MSTRRITVALLAFAGLCAGVAFLSLAQIDWSGWQQATCMPADCFCELVRGDAGLRQPVNAWSSLAFAWVGVWVMAYAPENGDNRMRATQLHPFIFGLSAVVIGAGSAFYHASLTFVGQFFDVFGMYLFTTYMLLYALLRLGRLSDARFGALYAGIMAALSVLLIALPDLRRFAFAFILIAAIIAEWLFMRARRATMDRKLFIAGVGLFALAFVIWILDNERILCAPAALAQGHAAWHLLGAVAVALLYFYYLSETPIVRDKHKRLRTGRR
jgi:hypothetical protein